MQNSKSYPITPISGFVGRTAETEQLRSFLHERTPAPRVATVGGKTGIGKSRLVREALRAIKGAEVCWVDCLPQAMETSYYPFRELLKLQLQKQGQRMPESVPPAYRLEIGKLLPEITGVTADLCKGIDPVLDRYRLYESIRLLLEKGPPVKIVVFDNIQWVDHESPQVIKYLLRTINEKDLAFVFICRDEDKTERLETFFSDISRENRTLAIYIQPLNRGDMGVAVQQIIGKQSLTALQDFVVRESGGNPLFLEQIIRNLHEDRYLFWDGTCWKFQNPGAEFVPKNIASLTDRLYRKLSRDAQTILKIASVIGCFDLQILNFLTGFGNERLVGLIDEISRTGLIRKAPGSPIFSEELSREAVCAGYLDQSQCREYHRLIGAFLTGQPDQRKLNRRWDEIAFHYYRGRETEQGPKYCIAAGDKARESYAYREALKYYSWAIELLEAGGDAPGNAIAGIKLKIGRIYELEGNYSEALLSFRAVRENNCDAKHLSQAMLRTAGVYLLIDKYDEGLAMLDKAEAALCANGEIGILARAEINILRSRLHRSLGDLAKAQTEGRAGLEQAEKAAAGSLEAERIKVLCYNNLGIISQTLGDYDQAVRHCGKSLELSELTGDKQGIAIACNNLGNIYKDRGEYATAIKLYEKSLAVSEEIGDKQGIGNANNNIGIVNKNQGEYNRAIIRYQTTMKICEELGSKQGVSLSSNNLGNIYVIKGDHTRAGVLFTKSLGISREIGDKKGMGMALNNIGNIYLDYGEYQRAREHYRQYLEISRNLGYRMGVSVATINIGITCFYQGRYRQAGKYFLDYQGISRELGNKLGLGIASLYLGLLAMETRKLKEAERQLLKAKEIFTGIGNKPQLIIVHQKMAELKITACGCGLQDRISLRRLRDEALANAAAAEQLSRTTGSVLARAGCHLVYGDVYAGGRDFKRAGRHYKKAIGIFTKQKQPTSLAEACQHYAFSLRRSGSRAKAGRYLNKALNTYRALALGAQPNKTIN